MAIAAPSPRQEQMRLVRSDWLKQPDIDTPVPKASITTPFNLVERNGLSVSRNRKELRNCAGNRVGYHTFSRSGALPINIYATAYEIAGVLGFAFGVVGAQGGSTPFETEITMLPDNLYDLPLTSFAYVFAGSSNGTWAKSFACNSVRILDKLLDFTTINSQWFGRGDRAALSPYTIPACPPVGFLTMLDGAFNVNGVDRFALDQKRTTEIEFVYENNMPIAEHPFVGASIETQRMQRGSDRNYYIRWQVEGEENDALHQLALADTVVPVIRRWGTGDDYVELDMPNCILREDTTPTGFSLEANLAVLNLILEPIYEEGSTDSPIQGLVSTELDTPILP